MLQKIFFVALAVVSWCTAQGVAPLVDYNDVQYKIYGSSSSGYYAYPWSCGTNVTHLIIPRSIIWEGTECPVRGINNQGFYFKNNIESVTIDAQLDEIEYGTFSKCKNLKHVSLPNTIKSIGNSAFSGCVSLSTINTPTSLETIGSAAFESTALTDITLPLGLKKIESRTFAGCRNLSQINIPQGLEMIGTEAFQNCEGLQEITIPSSVKTIGASAFVNCAGLRSDIVIPPGCTVYGCAFDLCVALKRVEIKSGVMLKIDGARGLHFGGCTNLYEVKIHEGVESLPEQVFYACTSLSMVTIPSTMTNIEIGAFGACPSIENICLAENNNTYYMSDGFLVDTKEHALIAASGLRGTVTNESISIPSGTKIIGYVFHGVCNQTINRETNSYSYEIIGPTVSAVSIPDSVETMTGMEFRGCNNLRELRFKGKPPTCRGRFEIIVLSTYQSNAEGVIGYYPSKFKTEWEEVLDENGYWNGLKMEENKLTYTVTYSANGGNGTAESQTCEYGGDGIVVDDGDTLHWEGHWFLGWAFSPEGGVVYRAGDTIVEPTDGDMVNLYAVWGHLPLTLTAESADWSLGSITLRCEDGDLNGTAHLNLQYYDKSKKQWCEIDRDDLEIFKPVVETDASGNKLLVARIKDTRFVQRNNGVGTVSYRVADESGRVSECSTRQRHALFVAVSEYADPLVSDLGNPSPKHEVAVIRSAYERYGDARGFIKTCDDNPTKANALSWLEIMSESVTQPGDIFLFCFAGHGTTGILCCHDYDRQNREKGGITTNELFRCLTSFRDGIGLVSIIYCCNADGMFIQDNDSLNGGRIGWIFSSRTGENTIGGSLTGIVFSEGWFNGRADELNGEYGRGNGDGYVTFDELGKWGYDWTRANNYCGNKQYIDSQNTFILMNIVAGMVPPNSKPDNMFKWLAAKATSLFTASNGDVDAAAAMTAANGCRTVGECYELGINPEDPDDDLKITNFKMKDGKPEIMLNHTKDGSGNSFEDRIKILGKAELTEGEWQEVPPEGNPAHRFFKVGVEMP